MRRRSFSGRLLGTLSLVLLPLAIYMVGITLDQARQVRESRQQTSASVLGLANRELENLIYRALAGQRGVAITEQDLAPASRQRLHAIFDTGDEVGLIEPEDSSGLMIIAARSTKGGYIMRAVGVSEVDRGLALTLQMPRDGVGVFDDRGHALVGAFPDDWSIDPARVLRSRPVDGSVTILPQKHSDVFIAVPARSNATIILASAPSKLGSRVVWLDVGLILLMTMFGVVAAILLIDETIFARVEGLARIARAHSRGRFSVRFKAIKGAPVELRRLGMALNEMADSSARQVNALEASEHEKNRLILELHHRVKNNFQVLESLLSLLKKGIAPGEAEHLRFIEDHVRAMAVADRTAYGAHGMRAPLDELISGVIDGLRTTAGLSPMEVRLETGPDLGTLDLDRAVALCLLLSAAVPPSFDEIKQGGEPIRIRAALAMDGKVNLDLIGAHVEIDVMSPQRQRLVKGYTKQLLAEQTALMIDGKSVHRITISGVQASAL